MTSFIIESYKTLQPDPQITTVDLLRQLVAQNNGTIMPAVDVLASDTPFKPAFSDVLQNSALFASLICSLLAAAMGILYKEWLREYAHGLPDDPREFLRVRQFRHIGMQRWRMRKILLGIAILLQLGVAFFIFAVVLFVWPLHPFVRLVVNALVAAWLGFWIGTASCPLLAANCPYKSPISHFVFGIVSLARRMGGRRMPWATWSSKLGPKKTLETQEQDRVAELVSDLDRDALKHLFNSNWGDAWLENLDPCVEDLDTDVALKLICELVALRCAPVPLQLVLEGCVRVADPGVMHLAGLWRRIQGLGRRPGMMSTEMPSSATLVETAGNNTSYGGPDGRV